MTNQLTKTLNDYYAIAEEVLELKNDTHTIIIKAVGGSMHPTILYEDEIVIDSYNIENLAPGDIITFVQKSSLICHRIKEIKFRDNQKFFITQGDSSAAPEPYDVDVKQVVGKVVSIIRKNRRMDPYNIPEESDTHHILSRLLMELNAATSLAWSFLKEWIKEILTRCGLYSVFTNIIFRVIKYKIEYFFLLPVRQTNSFPIYKRLCIPVKDILNKDKLFFEPLKTIGAFRLIAKLGGERIADIELIKYIDEADEDQSWLLKRYRVKGLFSKSEMENKLFELCYSVLDAINVKKLYLMPIKGEKRPYYYLSKWNARYGQKYNKRKLYLMPGENSA